MATTFRQFLLEDSKPFYFEAPRFRKAMKKADPQTQRRLNRSLADFKAEKTSSPGYFVRSMNDHALEDGIYDVHLIHGILVMLYYHCGDYIILLDIVPHIDVDRNNFSTTKRRYLPAMPDLIKAGKLALEASKKKPISEWRIRICSTAEEFLEFLNEGLDHEPDIEA